MAFVFPGSSSRGPSRGPFVAPTFPRGGGSASGGGGAGPGPAGARGPAGPPGPGFEGMRSLTEFSPQADGVTDDTDALNALFGCGATHVFIPPGTYKVAGAVVASEDYQFVRMAPGAEFLVDPDSGSVEFAGERQRLSGLSARVALASSASGGAIKVSGANSKCVDGVSLSVEASVPNFDMLTIAADEVQVSNIDILITGDSAFRFGVNLEGDASTYVNSVVLRGLNAEMGAPSTDVTYGALLNWKGKGCKVYDLTIRNCGGHTLFPDGVVIIDGTRNKMYDPRIELVTGAKYGIYRKFAAEFLTIVDGIIQGRNNGTYYSGSEGIYSGNAAGHLKLFGTAVTGWEYAHGIHGTCDTPVHVGAVLANNKLGAIKIDSRIEDLANGFALGDWPVSGLVLHGCYGEAQAAGSSQHFVHVVSGSVPDASVQGCFVGVAEGSRILKIESSVTGQVGFTFDANRFSVGGAGGEILEPGGSATTVYWRTGNALHNVPALSTDATKVLRDDTPALVGATIGSGGIKVGSSGTTQTLQLKYANTANFANALTAGTSFELTYTVTGALTTDNLQWNVNGAALAANTNLSFHAYISATNTVKLRARNHSAVDQTGVTGSFFCTVTRYV